MSFENTSDTTEDQFGHFDNRGNGLGNILSSQSTVPNLLSKAPHSHSRIKKNRKKVIKKPEIQPISKKVGFGKKRKSRRKKSIKRNRRKPNQIGKGVSRYKKRRLRRLYALRQSPF